MTTSAPQARSVRVLVDGFDRVDELVTKVVSGLGQDQLSWRPQGTGNSIAWLVWHLTRIQDDHLAEVAAEEQVWTAQGWMQRFALPFDAATTGYGHTSAEVDAVRVESPDLLRDYHRAVHQQSVRQLGHWGDEDLDRVVDERWDPPVTLAVRLVSVLSDTLQHVGQARYLRGLLPGR
jgi:uncharacterized damage-inducible protein DinB